MEQSSRLRAVCLVALMIASSAFAYALGRQQGEAQAREDLGIQLPAGNTFPALSLASKGGDDREPNAAPTDPAAEEPATFVTSHDGLLR